MRESIVNLNQIGTKKKKQKLVNGDEKKDEHESSDEEIGHDIKPPYLASDRFNVLSKIQHEDDFYHKEHVEMMFL